MVRLLGISLLFLGSSSFVFAGVTTVPEIDANAAAGAVTLLTGGLLVLRARRRAR